MALSDQHKRFALEYLIDFNATAAYLRAGYRCTRRAAETSAHKLLRNPEIQAYLANIRQEISDRTQVSLERTMQEIARVAYCDITNILEFDQDGVRFKRSKDLPSDVTAAIAQISSQESTTDDGTPKLNFKIKMHNKISALSLLADFFGIRDDFNKARATLRRYGLALIEDENTECGWAVVRAEG